MTSRKMQKASSYIVFLFYIPKSCACQKYDTKAYLQTSNNTISLVNVRKKKNFTLPAFTQKILLEYKKNASPTFVHITSHHLPLNRKKRAPPPWRYLHCGSAQSTCTSSTGPTQPLPPLGRNPSKLMIGETLGSYET